MHESGQKGKRGEEIIKDRMIGKKIVAKSAKIYNKASRETEKKGEKKSGNSKKNGNYKK